MKNLLLGCFLASLFFACNSEKQEVSEEESCEQKVVPNNSPNDDSELALLMRKLYLDADSIKQLIVNKEGGISDAFIAELEIVHGAIPTDPAVKTAEFDAFNKSLINQAKALKENTANQTEGFNQLVNRCIDCHQSFCPGPIKRIKKLHIN